MVKITLGTIRSIFFEFTAQIFQVLPILLLRSSFGKGRPSFQIIWTEACSLTPFRFRLLAVVLRGHGNSQMVVPGCIVRGVLYCSLQNRKSIIEFALAKENLPLENKRFRILGSLFQDSIIQPDGLVHPIVENQKLDVAFLDSEVIRVLCGESAELLYGFVQQTTGEIGVCKHAVGKRIRGQLVLGIGQNLLTLCRLILGKIQTGKRSPRRRIFGCSRNCGLELCLCFGDPFFIKIKCAQREIGNGRLRIQTLSL